VAAITIRNLDDSLKSRLRVRAARHGRSMEEEVREILSDVLDREKPHHPNLVQAIRRHIEPLGGAELPLLPRQPVRRPPRLTR
jgi:plasmid stability protein